MQKQQQLEDAAVEESSTPLRYGEDKNFALNLIWEFE